MPLPVISIAQMREWEQATWATGQTEAEVIRRVGKCVAHQALRLTRPGDLIFILAGKGHNGEDARAARVHLAERRVEELLVAEPATDLAKLEPLLGLRPALIIDGLFGIGLNRALSPEWIQLICRVNEARAQVLAVDVPSGLHGDTGQPQGAAIQAAVTLTVGAPKAGLLLESAWPYVGRLEVASDDGLAACTQASELQWTLAQDFVGFPPARPPASHKGSYGHLALVAGSLGYHGAAVLAARGAQRAQPGLITLYTLEASYYAVAAQLQAVMVAPWNPEHKLPGSWGAVLVGPGLAAADIPDQMKLLVRHLWRDSPAPVVVDASALDWLPLELSPKNAVRVITPHPGEAARLLRSTGALVQGSRLEALRSLSKRFANTWVVLKGYQTLVGRSTGEVYVNPSGNPHLAQGGSGDVLAGYIAGLLAQPARQSDPLTTLRYAVWQHGAAADALQASRRNWVVEDLIDALGQQEPGPRDRRPEAGVRSPQPGARSHEGFTRSGGELTSRCVLSQPG
jgi:ADP-dependent NAD(P)H-hydrate dehydratase / NAD(P)H-hydrate epimerase